MVSSLGFSGSSIRFAAGTRSCCCGDMPSAAAAATGNSGMGRNGEYGGTGNCCCTCCNVCGALAGVPAAEREFPGCRNGHAAPLLHDPRIQNLHGTGFLCAARLCLKVQFVPLRQAPARKKWQSVITPPAFAYAVFAKCPVCAGVPAAPPMEGQPPAPAPSMTR